MSARCCLLLIAVAAAACTALPDIPLGVCGNHIQEDGEDCDTVADPRCIAPGKPGACHLSCVRDSDCAIGSVCAANVCRVAVGCGNRQIEPDLGEECDSPGPGCGAPDGGVAACRQTCDSQTPCPAGFGCGRDRICRQPSGLFSYTTYGSGGGKLALADLDLDGYLDLIDRQRGQLLIFRNDHHGGFDKLLASGVARSEPLERNGAGVTVIQPGNSPSAPQLIAAITPSGIDILQQGDGATLRPLIVGEALLFTGAGNGRLLGTFVDHPNRDGKPLFLQNDAELATYDLPTDYQQGANAPVLRRTTIAGPSCPFTGLGYRTATVYTPPGKSSLVLLQEFVAPTGPTRLCVARTAVDDSNFVFEALPVPAGVGADAAVFGDVNADGIPDVLGPAYGDHAKLFVWLGTDARFAPPAELPLVSGGSPLAGPSATVDFDGDGRDDLVAGLDVLLNRDNPDGGVGLDNQLELVLPRPDVLVRSGAPVGGDLNHDRAGDFALLDTSTASGDVTTCLGDGSGRRFTCAATTLPFTVSSLQVGDVNGDLTNDLLAVGNTSSSTLGVILGRPLAPLDPTPRTFPLYGLQLLGATLSPHPPQIASDLFVSLLTFDGQHALALGHADPSGEYQFGYPMPAAQQIVSQDVDLDGAPDIVVLHGDTQPALTRLYSSIGVPFNGGGFLARAETTPIPDLVGSLVPPQLVLLGVESQPVIVAMLDSKLTLVHPGAPHAYSSEVVGGPLPPASTIKVVDLDGDGRRELVVISHDFGLATCTVSIARFLAAQQPPRLTSTVLPVDCEALDFSVYFVDVTGPGAGRPPPDGRLDVVLKVQGNQTVALVDGDDHIQLLGDGTTPTPLFDLGNGMVIPFDRAFLWIDTVDLDGDGIPDLVMQTPEGAVVALAQVLRR